MCVCVYLFLKLTDFFLEVVNNRGKSGFCVGGGGGGLYFTLSPFIFNRRAELQRELQTSRPLSCAEERIEPEQVAKANVLNEHYNQVHVRACAREFEQ